MSSIPWRLPHPPGLQPGATSVRGATGGDDESPVFTFQRRVHRLNWRELLHVDLNRIIQHVDLAALHSQIESVTFADIGQEDLAYFTDANFLHLFRLCQLLLEYQLFAWQASTVSGNLRTAKYVQLKSHVTKLKAKLTQAASENKALKKELKYCKQVIAALDERRTGSVMQAAGSIGRFAHLAPHVLQPHTPAAPHPLAAQAASAASTTAAASADVHAHYAAQFEAFQASIGQQMRDSLREENDKRNAKLEALQSSLQMLLQAQQAEATKHAQAQAQVQAVASSKSSHEEEKTNDPPPAAAATLTPAQEAQQQLLTSILSEVSQLKAHNARAGEEAVSIAAFDPTTLVSPTAAAATTGAMSTTNANAPAPAPRITPHSSQVYDFSRPTATAAAAATSEAASKYASLTVQAGPFSPAAASAAILSTRPLKSSRPKPDLTPAQQIEVDALASWLKNVEAEELGAEILQIQLESQLIQRAEEERQRKAREEEDERAVREVEEAIPPDHPLLADTILASPLASVRNRSRSPKGSPRAGAGAGMPLNSPTAAASVVPTPIGFAAAPTPFSIAPSPYSAAAAPTPNPWPFPSTAAASVAPTPSSSSAADIVSASPHANLTVEIQSPASMPLTRGVLVGNSLIAPPLASPSRVALGASSNARAPILPPAPLADPMPDPLTLEEKAVSLLALSPSSRSRAIQEEKALIKLRSVILARSSPDVALHHAFPSLPFLPSLFNHAPEELRECYDTTYLWCDTAMRTEENAQELLKYAVQMDCTGEIYAEVAQRVDDIVASHYAPPPAVTEARTRLAAQEVALPRIIESENARALREAQWHEDRIAAFEAEWVRLQDSEEEKAYYEELEKQNKQTEREVAFQKYLQQLVETEKAMSAAHKQKAMNPQPPEEQVPIMGRALIPKHNAALTALSPRSGGGTRANSTSPVGRSGGGASFAATAGASGRPESGVSRQHSSPARAGRSRALQKFTDDEEDDEDAEDNEEEGTDVARLPSLPSAAAPAAPSGREQQQTAFKPSTAAAAPATQRASSLSPARTNAVTRLANSTYSPHALPPPSAVAAAESEQKQPFPRSPNDDDDEEDEDEDLQARQAVARMASAPILSSFEPSAASQFSRPGATKRGGTLQSTTSGPNRTPDQSTRALQPSLKPGGNSNASSSIGGALSRPRTAVGSGATTLKPRFATGGFDDSFEDDVEDEHHQGQSRPLGAADEPAEAAPAQQSKAADQSRDGARTLNPRRAAANNADVGSSLGGGMLGSRPGASSSSARPSAHLAPAAHVESDPDVSDVSVMNLSEGESSRPAAAARQITPPNASAVPAHSPMLASSLSTGGPVLQGRGRPRSQAGGRLGTAPSSSVNPPLSRPSDDGGGDSLSSLLGGGGGMRRPGGGLSSRGLLSSGPGSYRAKLAQNNLESENDSSLDLND